MADTVGAAERPFSAAAPDRHAARSGSRLRRRLARRRSHRLVRHTLKRNGVVAITLAIVVAPFVVALAALTRLGDHVRPWGDLALIETSVRAVGSRSVLLGPYSQWGWRHPGPLYFYLLAAPYRLLGSNYWGLFVGSVLIAALSALGVVLLAARRGGRGLAVWSAAVVLVFLGAAGELAVDAWNPRVTMLPFALALMLAWTAAARDLWAVPIFAAVATFVVQTHLEYGLSLGAVAVALLAVVAWDARRSRRDATTWPSRRRTLRWTAGLTAAILAALWLPALVDQVLHDPGNAHAIVSFFGSHSGDHSLGAGARQVGAFLGAIPARVADGTTLHGAAARTLVSWPTLVSTGALMGAALVAWRRQARDLALLVGLVTLVLGCSVISVSRIVGPISEYLVAWIAAIGIPLWIAAGWAAAMAMPSDWLGQMPALARRGLTAISVAALAVLAIDAASSLNQIGDPAPTTITATAMTDAVRGRLPSPHTASVVVRVHGNPQLVPWAQGLLDGLEAHGYAVRVERSAAADVSLWPWELTTRTRGATVVNVRPASERSSDDIQVGPVAIGVTRGP